MKRDCDHCGGEYEAKSRKSRFCTSRCRLRAHRQPKPQDESPDSTPLAATPAVVQPLVAQVMSELEAAGRLVSAPGVQAVLLASRMEGFETGAGLAALSKELSRVMAEALAGAVGAADPMDELSSRRAQKIASA